MGLLEFLFKFLEKVLQKFFLLFKGPASKGYYGIHKLGKGAIEMFAVITILLFKVITYSVIKILALA